MNTKTKTKTSTVVTVLVGIAAVGAISAAAAMGVLALKQRCVDNGYIQYGGSTAGYYPATPGYYVPGPKFYKETTPGYTAVAAPKCERLMWFLNTSTPKPKKTGPLLPVPTVNHVDLPYSNLINGKVMDVYKFTVTASVDGNISLKQLRFPIGFSDTTDNNTLEMGAWKLYKNGTDISSNSDAVVIQNQMGQDIEGEKGVGADDEAIYVIWDTGEEVITAGTTVTYTLRATAKGFGSDSNSGVGDAFAIVLKGDSEDIKPTLCLEDSGPGDIWQLDKPVGGACTTASNGNIGYNFIWSHLSGDNHSSDTETGTNDWANGYGVKNLPLSNEVWTK